MTTIRLNLGQHGELPEDLREWFEEPTLVRLCLESLQSVEAEPAQPPPGSELPCGRPRALLTILLYSYATGRQSSKQIEERSSLDPQLRYLCGNALPSANELRRVRRHDRPYLQCGLSRLFSFAWQQHRASLFLDFANPPPEIFDAAAEQRVNQAVLLDTAALDN